ncbi:MAG: hypothetical protein Q9161_000050 [Pseudevernia consocians]
MSLSSPLFSDTLDACLWQRRAAVPTTSFVRFDKSKSMFKEEISATIMSRQFRPFVPVRWLFKRSKDRESEARLHSKQSMLQVLIHPVTVSKLGDMQSKYVGDDILKSLQNTRDSVTRAVALYTPKAATFSVRILSIAMSFTGPGVEIGRGLYQSGRRDHDRASTSHAELPNGKLPGELHDPKPGNGPNGTEGARERKPAVSELRITVPHLEPIRQPIKMPLSRKSANRENQRENQKQELREAMADIEHVKSNRDEAERVEIGNYTLMPDIVYFLIPYQEARIVKFKEKLKADHKRAERDGRDRKGAPTERQDRVPHTVVETDSEAGEGPESTDVNDSEDLHE